ncbi:MAG TPA: beta-ketoacyl synthase chain length factor [Candidatus Sulfotelmatobacter sp.]|nr:beta-ketoacyl synthase chain length factor [Candidatus Sulfotelmatobacter sp.]
MTISDNAVRFAVAGWAAWAPGLADAAAWRRWARGEADIGGADEPRAGAVPPLLRRRASPLHRMALEVACACGAGRGQPAVFCSRHGDLDGMLALLHQLAAGEPLSPASFGMSAQNAPAGLLSIARADRAPSTTIAGGEDGVADATIEACGLLADDAPEVVLIVHDVPLPTLYQPYADEPEWPYAWAWRLHRSGNDLLRLSWEPAAGQTSERPGEPMGLRVLRFFLAGAPELVALRGRRVWRWSRDG